MMNFIILVIITECDLFSLFGVSIAKLSGHFYYYPTTKCIIPILFYHLDTEISSSPVQSTGYSMGDQAPSHDTKKSSH